MTIEIGPNLTIVIFVAPFVWYGARFLWREVNTERAKTRAHTHKWSGVIEP